jgi:hypothetical protein
MVIPFPARPVGAGGRLTHTAARAATTDRSDAIAARIREDRGSVWGAVRSFDISYSHACRIRAGWRTGGRRAEPIPFVAQGWTNGRRNGWAGREAARG